MSTRTLPSLELLREICKPYIQRASLIDQLNARVDIVLDIHQNRNQGHFCVHCGLLWEEHGQFTNDCPTVWPYEHTTKFEALRCQFEIPLNSAGTVVEICGKWAVTGKTFCGSHLDED